MAMKESADREQHFPPEQYERLSVPIFGDLDHMIRVRLTYERSKIVGRVSCSCQGFCSGS
jgi:hypothetical protein